MLSGDVLAGASLAELAAAQQDYRPATRVRSYVVLPATAPAGNETGRVRAP
jgi:hypothetical protein